MKAMTPQGKRHGKFEEEHCPWLRCTRQLDLYAAPAYIQGLGYLLPVVVIRADPDRESKSEPRGCSPVGDLRSIQLGRSECASQPESDGASVALRVRPGKG